MTHSPDGWVSQLIIIIVAYGFLYRRQTLLRDGTLDFTKKATWDVG
jgi:hypothetical protein